MEYALNCAGLRCWGGGLRRGSCGGDKGRMPYAPTIRAFSFLYVRTTFSTHTHPLHNTITHVRPSSLPRCCVFRRRRGAYGIRPGLRGFAKLHRRFAVRLMRLCKGVCYTPLHICRIQSTGNIHRLYDYAKTKIVCFFQMPRKLHRTWEKLHRT